MSHITFLQEPLLHSAKIGEDICRKSNYLVLYWHFLAWKNLSAFSLPPLLLLCSDNSIICFLVHFTRIWDITQHLHDSWGIQHTLLLIKVKLYCSLFTDAKLRCKGIKREKKSLCSSTFLRLLLSTHKIVTGPLKLSFLVPSGTSPSILTTFDLGSSSPAKTSDPSARLNTRCIGEGTNLHEWV